MARYSLEIKRSAVKELGRIPPKDRQRIVTRIRALGDCTVPRFAEALWEA